MPLFGPPNIEKLEEKRDVKGLINARTFHTNNEKVTIQVQSGACRALGRLQAKEAVESLLATLEYSKYPEVKTAAVEALGRIGDVRAVEPLRLHLKKAYSWEEAVLMKALVSIEMPDADSLAAGLVEQPYSFRLACAERLGEIGGQVAIEKLLAAIDDAPPRLRKVFALALEKTGWQPDRTEAGAWYWIAKQDWEKCKQIGQLAVLPLIAALHLDENDFERENGACKEEAQWFVDQGDYFDRKKIQWDLHDENKGLQEGLEKTIIEIGGDLAIKGLNNALADPGCFGAHPQVVELIRKLGGKPDGGKAGAFYWCAEKDWNKVLENGVPGIEALSFCLVHNYHEYKNQPIDLMPEDKLNAAKALCGIQDPAAVPSLIHMLRYSQKEIRVLAAKALLEFHRLGKLDENTRLLILKERAIIQEPHSDTHDDNWVSIGPENCNLPDKHADEHTDSGIGVEFPL